MVLKDLLIFWRHEQDNHNIRMLLYNLHLKSDLLIFTFQHYPNLRKLKYKIASDIYMCNMQKFIFTYLHTWTSLTSTKPHPFFGTFIMALSGTCSDIYCTLLAIITPRCVSNCILYEPTLTSNVLNVLTNSRLLFFTVGHLHGTFTYKCFQNVLIWKL